jgi:hypothetical protein
MQACFTKHSRARWNLSINFQQVIL